MEDGSPESHSESETKKRVRASYFTISGGLHTDFRELQFFPFFPSLNFMDLKPRHV
jgi:hypothetical protein